MLGVPKMFHTTTILLTPVIFAVSLYRYNFLGDYLKFSFPQNPVPLLDSKA